MGTQESEALLWSAQTEAFHHQSRSSPRSPVIRHMPLQPHPQSVISGAQSRLSQYLQALRGPSLCRTHAVAAPERQASMPGKVEVSLC